jgi:hypothetical protein
VEQRDARRPPAGGPCGSRDSVLVRRLPGTSPSAC